MEVKHRLPQLMAQHKIRTVSDLSVRASYGYHKLNRFYRNEHKTLDPELIAALCKVFKCDISELLYLEGR